MIVVYYTDYSTEEYATRQEAEIDIREKVCGSDFAVTVECVEEDEKNLMVNWEVSLDDDGPGNAKEKATHSCAFRQATLDFFAPLQRRLEDLEDDNNINGADLVDHFCEFYQRWKTLAAADAEQAPAPVDKGESVARTFCPSCGQSTREHAEDCTLLKESRRFCGKTDDIEIDQDAQISEGDDGWWVSAWIWIPKPATEEEKNDA